MKKFINKVANDRKLSSAIAFAGIVGGCVCNIITIAAIFYNGMRKGVDAAENSFYEKELEAYKKGSKANG